MIARRCLWVVAAAWLLSLGSGCIAWRTHLEPGVAGFPESVRRETPAPVRLKLDAWTEGTDESGATVLDASADDIIELARALAQANAVRDAAPDLAFADGTLRVVVRSKNLGKRWQSILTLSTLGLVPYFGGRRVEAEAELLDSAGNLVAAWTSRAEAAQVAHLLLLTGWGVERLRGLRVDALRGVVTRLLHELEGLSIMAAAPTGDRATGSAEGQPLKRR